MAWNISRIYAKNFMSFEEIDINIKAQCFLVQAENRDDLGQKSNGVGKSSLLDIVPICLLSQSVTGRNLKDCINLQSGAKSFEVFLEGYNSITKEKLYIARKIHAKKASELIIQIDGKVPDIPSKQGVEDGVDIAAGNAFILEEILQISREDLLNYYFTSEKYYTPFLKASNTAKMEVISRFASISSIDAALLTLDNELLAYEKELADNESKIRENLARIEAYQNMNVDDLLLRKEEKKKALLLEVDRLRENQKEAEGQSITISERIERLQATIDTVEILDTTEKENALESLYLRRKEIAQHQYELQLMLNQLEAQLQSTIACPRCSHQFILNSETTLEEVHENLNDAVLLVDAFDSEKAKNHQELIAAEKDIESARTERQKQEQYFLSLKSQVSQSQFELKNFGARISRYETEIAQTFAELHKVEKYDVYSAQSGASKKVLDIEQINDHLEKERGKLAEEVHLRKSWVKYFEDFKYYIINKPIKSICGNVNYYLEKIGSDLSVLIEGFKMLKSGKVKQALNPMVYRNGLGEREYTSFSSGEKARMNIATDLAFMHIINQSKSKGGLNWYQSDELLSPVDDTGIESILHALGNLNKTIFLVSHSTGLINYEQKIKLVKENGVAKVE